MTEKRGDIMDHGESGEASVEASPQWLRDRLEWFQDLKFGLFLHWGPYCQWSCCESWPLVEEDTWARPDNLKEWVERGRDLERFRRDYRALNRTFNPVDFDPAIWAAAARQAGMKYLCLTSKHHDGFCMFDTRTTDYRVTHESCPFHADPRANILKHAFDAFREQGLAISCYFSKSDWNTPYYWRPETPARTRNPNYDTHTHPERWGKFVEFVHRQIEELATGYGPIDVLWLDGGQVQPPDQDIRMAELAAMARSRQPGLIIADRTVGGPYENILTPEQTVPDAPLGHPWESCVTMGRSWKYVECDEFKPTRALIHMLVDVVAKGGNLLLGVGPSPKGLLPAEALDRMRGIGDWMAVNAEAIHGTRAVAPYQEGTVRYTKKGRTVYAIVLAPEGRDDPPEKVVLTGLAPAPGSSVRLLGCDQALDWAVARGRVEVTMPVHALPCEHAWVLGFAPAGGA